MPRTSKLDQPRVNAEAATGRAPSAALGTVAPTDTEADSNETEKHRTSLMGIGGKSAIVATIFVLLGNIVAFALLSLSGIPFAADYLGAAIVVTLTSSAFGALGGFLFSRSLRRRISLISEALGQAELGDYAARVADNKGDEIGLLAKQANLLCTTAERRELRMTASAMTDALTGLPNRALLSNRLEQMITKAGRDASQFAVALIDLDRFKWINDTLGHDAGDKLLRVVAGRLSDSVRASDTVARLGGDEFVLLIHGGLSQARIVADHLLQSIKAPVKLAGQDVDVSLSIGIAIFPEHGDNAKTLMRHADSAMYDAKRKRSGRAEHKHATVQVNNDREREQLSLLGEMRSALTRDDFLLVYQPKLDLNTGLIRSVEGLIRWKHPKRGMVPPGEFIPLAEKSGFMRELTPWVVRAGAQFAQVLNQAELDVRVAVNVSTMDLENAKFADVVEQIISTLALDPTRLGLEITETGVLSETESAMRNLRRISALGVKLSVDDFGTGYASLAQLQKLKVDELKIDRAFVYGMTKDRGNATIVKSTIDMGRQLGLNVVAEGVETAAEMRALASMGCDEIQGFFLAKPMPGEELIDWVRTRHALHDHSQDEYFKMLLAG